MSSSRDRRAQWRSARGSLSREHRREARAHFGWAALYGAIAIIALGVGSSATIATFHPPPGHPQDEPRIIAALCLVVFVVFGILATRRAARVLGVFMTIRAARAAGAGVRLLVTAVGYVVVLFGALGLLGINAGHLLVGGTVAGVILGIAAQQSLSNIFAGFVLFIARPFTVGDNIRVRAGALNGPFDGVVLGMSLTYVTLFVEGGVLKVPNSALLAAAVGQYPAKDRSVVDAARAAGAPFTPPQGVAAVPGPLGREGPGTSPPAGPPPPGPPPTGPRDGDGTAEHDLAAARRPSRGQRGGVTAPPPPPEEPPVPDAT